MKTSSTASKHHDFNLYMSLKPTHHLQTMCLQSRSRQATLQMYYLIERLRPELQRRPYEQGRRVGKWRGLTSKLCKGLPTPEDAILISVRNASQGILEQPLARNTESSPRKVQQRPH